MTQKIDGISQMLGEIKADVSHVRSVTEAMDNKMDGMNKNLIIAEQSIKSAHKRIDDLKTKVDNHETLKNKGFGWMAAFISIMGFIGATVGMFATQLWDIIFK